MYETNIFKSIQIDKSQPVSFQPHLNGKREAISENVNGQGNVTFGEPQRILI